MLTLLVPKLGHVSQSPNSPCCLKNSLINTLQNKSSENVYLKPIPEPLLHMLSPPSVFAARRLL